MRKPAAVLGTLALAAGLTSMPSPAQAATSQFGNACVADNLIGGATAVATAGDAGDPLPATAPATGVITQVSIQLPAGAGGETFPQKVKVVRPASSPGQYTFVAESGTLVTGVGRGPFPVRVPVRAGDLLGLGGPDGALSCTGGPGDVIQAFAGDVPVGTTAAPAGGGSAVSLPVVATIEPDADRDGYGDVTQDQCSQSAAVQATCPTVELDVFGVGQDGSILALVSASEPAEVKVAGVAEVGGKNLKLKGKTKKVRPGQLGRFSLRLPAALKAALAKLPASRSIAVKITATAPQVGTKKKAKDTATVRLRGTR